jgi:hypothetical protein
MRSSIERWLLVGVFLVVGAVNLAVNPDVVSQVDAQTGICDPETQPCCTNGSDPICVNGSWHCN